MFDRETSLVRSIFEASPLESETKSQNCLHSPPHTHTPTLASMIQGLVQLFIFQALGELVSKFALPFIPGPVLGLVLLLAYLSVRGHVPAAIDLVGGSVLQHLGLLFIPASVGVVLYLPVLQANAWAISAALVVSVVATVAVTAGLLKALAKKEPTDE
jgi:putative effector of murein hydrolase LrgA (UPF0299 family)